MEQSPLQLRLVLRGPDDGARDVLLTAPPETPAAAVAAALGRELALDGARLICARTGRALDGDDPIRRVGLSQGDELVVPANGVAPRPSEERAREVVISGGPATGASFQLSPGEHLLGRGADCALSIDDQALSNQHLALVVSDDGRVDVVDKGSRNGTLVEGVPLDAGQPRPLEPGEVVRAGRTLLELAPLPAPAATAVPDPEGFVPFNRPPRVHRPLEPQLRPFPPPPGDPHRSRLPMAAALIPLVLGVALYLITGFPTMLLFAALSPVLAVGTYIEDRRSGRRGFAESSRSYRQKLVALRDELEQERARELRRRRAASPSAPELMRRARRREAGLWERRADDADFLSLRLGTAEQRAHLSVRLDPGGSEELRNEAEELASWYASVPAAPVVAPLGELGALGICGTPERAGGLARWLVAQAAALHSPRDLVIAAAVSQERLVEWEWLKWLPHVSVETGPLAARLAVGTDHARELVQAVADLSRERRRELEDHYGGASQRPLPAVLLLLDEAVAPARPLVAETLGGAREAGVAVVWVGRERRDLPGECSGIVEIEAERFRLSYTDARSGDAADDVTLEVLSVGRAHALALALAPVRDTSAASAAAATPDRVTLLELLERREPDADWVVERWRESREGRVATIGAAAGEPFVVDLHRDGPHALVAGITGAGKSELLQALIASLATAYPPTRLTFLLVDYKGGAAFKDCVRLPHTVGYVTDLDGHLAQRALVSLNAELRRRERILRDAGAKDLLELEARNPERAPPSLVIVIDEFATLAREVPEFVDGVVDVAQRGRSLGVHLVLATQRPAGAVSDNIRAHTNLRIALRVNEAAESTDVIGAPDAARIARGRPGRGFARTGHGELTEFQAAYAGGAVATPTGRPQVVVRELRFDAPAELAEAVALARETELERLVEVTIEAAERERFPQPVRPWLPPLEPTLPLSWLGSATDESGDPSATAAVGLLDEPALQRQLPFVVDLQTDGSLLVYGASGSGKTTLLRTLALSLAESASPDELHLYGLDFATRGLVALEQLPHTGAVVVGEDEERVARLFTMLRRALERRKQLFARHGVFTLSEYRGVAGGEAAPRIVVLLDGYAGFVGAFERVNLGELVDALPRLVADGRPLGVHFAITADRRGAVANTLAGLVPAKIVLRMADDDEAAAFGIPVKAIRGAHLPPGRGFLPSGLELQLALPGTDAAGEAQASVVAETAERLSARWPNTTVPAIEPLPVDVERAALPAPEGPSAAVVGIGDAELEPFTVDLADRHFLVAGPYRSGRSTALATVVESLRRGPEPPAFHLLAPRRTPLLELPGWASVASGVDECDAAAARLAELTGPAVVVIDDGDELAETLAAAPLETLVRRGRDARVTVVAAAERQAIQRACAGWLRELRKDEHGLLLDPDTDVDGDLLGARLPRRSNPVFPLGRGYAVDRGLVELVQISR
jgi:DNA segregation ATPase FtsK/SpoIIIE, S-DNA-T family